MRMCAAYLHSTCSSTWDTLKTIEACIATKQPSALDCYTRQTNVRNGSTMTGLRSRGNLSASDKVRTGEFKSLPRLWTNAVARWGGMWAASATRVRGRGGTYKAECEWDAEDLSHPRNKNTHWESESTRWPSTRAPRSSAPYGGCRGHALAGCSCTSLASVLVQRIKMWLARNLLGTFSLKAS